MIVEEIVLKWFYKYLKVFEKKKSERMLTTKVQNHVINLREGFIVKKGKIYLLLRIERERKYRIKITTNVTSILCAKERQEEEDGAELLISEQLDN